MAVVNGLTTAGRALRLHQAEGCLTNLARNRGALLWRVAQVMGCPRRAAFARLGSSPTSAMFEIQDDIHCLLLITLFDD